MRRQGAALLRDSGDIMSLPSIFISYSRKDEAEKSALLSHLGVLQASRQLDVWSDDQIVGGADWKHEIEEAIARAQVAILLISVHFLTSDFILKHEVPKLLIRRSTKNLATFPVIAKACAWQHVDWLAQMMVRRKNGLPVWRKEGRHADEELAAIVSEVASLLHVSDPDNSSQNISALLQQSLDLCIATHFPGLVENIPSHSARRRIDQLREAIISIPMDLQRIEELVKTHDKYSNFSKQVRHFLREPFLQRLARRAGQGLLYEKLIFDNRIIS